MINLRDVARELGLQKENEVYYCPQHDTNTPDLYIEEGQFCCFNPTTEKGGYKAVSLVMHTKDWQDTSKALSWLSRKFPEAFNTEVDEAEAEARNVLNKATELANQALEGSEILESICEKRELESEDILQHKFGIFTDQVVKELEQEFSDEALQKSGLKKNSFFPLKGRLVVPYLDAEQTYYFTGRVIDGDNRPKYKKLVNTDYNENILYTLLQGSDKLLLTEGPFDAVSAYKAGYDVAAPVTSSFPEKQEEKLVEIAKRYDEVLLAFDQDDAGDKGAEKTAKLLLKNGADPRILDFTQGQDLDDYTTFNGYDLTTLEESSDTYLNKLIEEVEETDNRTKQYEICYNILQLVQDYPPAFIDRLLKDMPVKKPALEEELEQIRAETAKQQAVEKEVDLTEAESSIFRELRIGEEILELVPSTQINLQGHKYTLTDLTQNQGKAIQSEELLKIYSFSFGEGDKDEGYYLFTEPDQKLVLGEKNLPLKRINLDEKKYREPLYNKYQVLKQRSDLEGGFDEFKNQFKPAFTISDRLTPESVDKLKEIDNDAISNIVEEYLNNGFNIDPAVRAANYPKLLIHDKNLVRPQDIATYAGHTILYTNTKTGKSYTAGRVGEIRDKVTAAGILGYGDADGVNHGILDDLSCNFFADETSSKSHEANLNDKILSLMEKGEVTISQAGLDVTTRFYGSITYLGNPVNEGQKLDLNDAFVKIVEDLGNNVEAMASRLGLIVLDMELSEAEGSSLKKDRARKLETFVNWIQQQLAPKYTEIEEQMKSWLETGYPQDYLDDIDTYRKELVSHKLRDFWKSHKQSYRHARGQALRMAVYEKLAEVLKGDYSIEELCDLADDKFDQVMQMNLRSLENMANLNEHKKQEIRKARLEGETPKYLRYFVYSVIQKHLDDGIDSTISISNLKDSWLKQRDKLDISSDSAYSKWAPIQKKHRTEPR